MEKINEYYIKTAESDAHIMAMSEYQFYLFIYVLSNHIYIVLHPRRKMKYFKKNWSTDLQKDVANMVENIVCSESLTLSVHL